MFETLINQGRELLGIKGRVSKVAAERRKSVVTAQNKPAAPVTGTEPLLPGSWSGSSLTGAEKLWGFLPWDVFLCSDAALVSGFYSV